MIWRAALIVLAAAAALAPLSTAWVEEAYSSSVYPRVQAILTPVSNLVPFALFDVLIAIAGAGLLFPAILGLAKRRHTVLRTLGRFLLRAAVLGASFYLVFLTAWGLNY